MIRALPLLFLALSLQAQPKVTISWDDNREPAMRPYEVFNVYCATNCQATLVTHFYKWGTNYAPDMTFTVSPIYLAAFVPFYVPPSEWRHMATTTAASISDTADKSFCFYTVTTSNTITRKESPLP